MLPGGNTAAIGLDCSRMVSDVLLKTVLVLLAFITMVCGHNLLINLRDVVIPFLLAGFIVMVAQPSSELLYRLFAGLVPPYRWCCCCCLRRKLRSSEPPNSSNDEEGGVWAWFDTAQAQADREAAEPLMSQNENNDFRIRMLEGLCRCAAVLTVMSCMAAMLCGFLSLLVSGAIDMRQSWDAYQLGIQNLVANLDRLTHYITSSLRLHGTLDPQIKKIYNHTLVMFADSISYLLNYIVSSLSSSLSSFIIMFLYVLFWLLWPLPIGGKAGQLVRSYVWKKAAVSFLYGAGVSLMFLALKQDLAFLFGMVAFFLNFVPEVGALISILLPMPVILLDGRLSSPLLTLMAATAGQLILKLVIGNVVEVKLVEQDREMSIHPVWVLVGLNYFGFIWGPVGMLLSVPLMAILKSFALSAAQGSNAVIMDFAEKFLLCLEGRPGRDHKRHTIFQEVQSGNLASERDPETSPEASSLKKRCGEPSDGTESAPEQHAI